MRVKIFALLVSTTVSQFSFRIPQCKFFAKSLPRGVLKCASSSDVRGEYGSSSPEYAHRHAPPSPGVETLPQYNLGRRAILGAGTVGMSLGFPSNAKAASDVKLATFDKADKATTRIWGVIRGDAYDVLSEKGVLRFKGTVEKNPYRSTPEPWIMSTQDFGKAFPDVSSCEGISLSAKQVNKLVMKKVAEQGGGEITKDVPPYKGFRIAFGKKGGSYGGLTYGYKAKFDPPIGEFGTVKIPFKDFTNSWDPVTGDPIATCKDSPENCPDAKTLQNLGKISFWAQGVDGVFSLRVEEIDAYGCTAAATLQLATFDEASSTNLVWLPTAASLGLLVFFFMQIRRRKAPIAPSLLG